MAQREEKNRIAVVYDPDREQLTPLPGHRSLRGFVVSWVGDGGPEWVRFDPGVNWADAATWSRVQALPAVQQRLQVGALRHFQPREVGETETTSRYDEPTAKILVDNTWDLARLEEWLRFERRPAIQAYIRSRIEALREGRL